MKTLTQAYVQVKKDVCQLKNQAHSVSSNQGKVHCYYHGLKKKILSIIHHVVGLKLDFQCKVKLNTGLKKIPYLS